MEDDKKGDFFILGEFRSIRPSSSCISNLALFPPFPTLCNAMQTPLRLSLTNLSILGRGKKCVGNGSEGRGIFLFGDEIHSFRRLCACLATRNHLLLKEVEICPTKKEEEENVWTFDKQAWLSVQRKTGNFFNIYFIVYHSLMHC